IIPLVHIGILIGTESLVRRDPRLVFLIAVAVGMEFLVAFVLLSRQQANFSAVPVGGAELSVRPTS
ncbi:MAG: hypothetical protein WA636_05705, partial [Methylovirgula sp.]